MFCKHCGAKVEDDAKVCPSCNAQIEQEKEYVSPWKIITATAVCMVLLVVLVFAVIYGITGKLPFDLGAPETTAAPTEVVPTTAPEKVYTAEELGLVEGILTKEVYTAAEEALSATANEVVVTCGDVQLTNAQLQVMYWNQFYRFVNQYDYSSTGFDPTAPHSEQLFPQSDFTWEQYFLSGALQTWHQYAALNIAAKEAGYELPVNAQQDLAVLIEEYGKQAVENGFADADALLKAQMGPCVTLDDLVAVETIFAIGDNYYTDYVNGLEFTREEVEAFFDENADMFANNYGVDKETGKLVDVRHVLIQPEGCEFDENNYVVATDEQWEACRVEAQALLDAWAAEGATEDGFATLAAEHSTDGGSNTNGGLYQFVAEGQMVTAFNDWCFDETRKAGDYGLVKTEFGYHLMYFISSDDAWYLYAMNTSDGVLSGAGYEKITQYTEANPLVVLFEKVLIGAADLSVDEEETTEPTEGAAPTETTEATEGAAPTETAAPTTAAE